MSSLLARLTGRAAFTMARSMSTEAPAAAEKVGRQIVIPRPRGQFDGPAAFLQTIGRGCEKFTDKFRDWDHLFRIDSRTMKKDLGIGPKQRKWILMWTNKYRMGIDPYTIEPSKKHSMKRVDRLARAKRRGRK